MSSGLKAIVVILVAAVIGLGIALAVVASDSGDDEGATAPVATEPTTVPTATTTAPTTTEATTTEAPTTTAPATTTETTAPATTTTTETITETGESGGAQAP